MTAEVAILNKTAVALAADSAVTISAGFDQHKIFDSADKLFELTQSDPIGIMINNDMSFMEAPLPVLIKKFRADAQKFTHVRDAGKCFLEFLDEFARSSPLRIKLQGLEASIVGPLQHIAKTARDEWLEVILDTENGGIKEEFASETGDEVANILQGKIDEQLNSLQDVIEHLQTAMFVGDGDIKYTVEELEVFHRLADETLQAATQDQKNRASELLQAAMLKRNVSRSSTGVIFAGFGSEELFPTLVSYEVQGVIGDRLKYVETNSVDIDREGIKARVLPFAQREMVERFLYGLDTPLRDQISTFCQNAVPKISEEIIEALDLSEEDTKGLKERAALAEKGFFDGLAAEGFEAIQRSSEAEIEDMVEFMPKPEMARMAEALVNLTSIKRRVSRGFETVGGPIDVAIISKAEGFVWVNRKHYFPRELNERYFARMRAGNNQEEGRC